MTWEVVLSRQAAKDAKRIARSGLKPQAQKLLELLARNPFESPPSFEKLAGNLAGFFSRRINRQHRLVYEIDRDLRVVHVLRMWTHYE